MPKVLILAEGQTEEEFIKRILSPYLSPENIFVIPVVLSTKRIKSGYKFKGGVPSYGKVKKEIFYLLNDSSASLVTTMIDYYALPETFHGRLNPQGRRPYNKVQYVEKMWAEDISRSKFFPYLSLHEYEALLFSQPELIVRAFGRGDWEAKIQDIRNKFDTPEDIDDNPQTAPSKRIQELFPDYDKPFWGRLIAERIGLPNMRSACPHFNEWLSEIEKRCA